METSMTENRTLPPNLGEMHAKSSAVIGESKLSIRNLDFFYGSNKALKSIQLELPEKQVTGMIGPSGCGKSTLLRVLNRMYDLYPGQRAEGEVILDGQNILNPAIDLNMLRSRVGMVFQKPTPFPMSIYDNIAFGVKLHERLNKAQMDERGRVVPHPVRPLGRGQGTGSTLPPRGCPAASSSASASPAPSPCAPK